MPVRSSRARRAALAGVVIAAAAALTGCDVMSARSPSPRPSREASTPEPVPSPTETELEEVPTLRPDPSGSRLDLLDAANALADLDSYRVSVETRGLVEAVPAGGTASMTSTFVQGDEPAAEFRMTGVAGFTAGRLDAIVIGDQAWLREGGGRWLKSQGGAADFDAAFTTLSPIDLVGEFQGLGDALLQIGAETRNGRKTTHYAADARDAVASEAGLSKGTIDAWFATGGGYLVALEIDGTWDLRGTPTRVLLRIDVSRVNDPANRITPPV